MVFVNGLIATAEGFAPALIAASWMLVRPSISLSVLDPLVRSNGNLAPGLANDR